MHPGITYDVNLGAIARLAANLVVLTDFRVRDNQPALAELMANIAKIVYYQGPIFGNHGSMARPPEEIESRIRSEYAIACALSFAWCEYGYDIPLDQVPHAQLAEALVGKRWEALVEDFAAVLDSAMNGVPGLAESAERTSGTVDSVIGQIESDFAEVAPIPEASAAPVKRESHARSYRYLLAVAESFSNLRSVAAEEHWPTEIVARLIEDYLTPLRHAELAYFSSRTVSGDEWRRRYYWLAQRGEQLL
jgi:hypothetical protein